MHVYNDSKALKEDKKNYNIQKEHIPEIKFCSNSVQTHLYIINYYSVRKHWVFLVSCGHFVGLYNTEDMTH